MQFLSQWGEFLAAFGTFFLSHSIPVRPQVKSRITARIGTFGFTLTYSILSIAVLTWIISAAGRAPYIELWAWAPWQSHVTLIGMALACILVTMAIGQPNPLSFGGWNNHQFDPQNPGIIGWLHHPLLAGLFIWSASHLLPNGNLAHLIVFGLFAGFSLLGTRIINRRAKRILGTAQWQRLTATKRQIQITRRGLLRITLGLAIYLVILLSHATIIGVSPLP